MTPEYIAIHCSATKPSQDIGATEITQWHKANGWKTIGYHKVIRRDGVIEDGRPLTEPGAHVQGFNHCSIGICMVGGVDEKGNPENNFTQSQWDSLYGLVRSLLDEHPKAKVQGHRDFPNVNKACPSFDVKAWLKEVGL
jgi:N-acetylmuramoyl-L-alanine amidase